MSPLDFDQWLTTELRPPLVMGVLNVTPDSFSDGGKYASPEAAIAHAQEMAEAGASIIDIGGESTRPGSDPVLPDEQIRRVIPVLKSVAHRLPVVFSIDTTQSEVASAALDAGATIINDISAGRDDPADSYSRRSQDVSDYFDAHAWSAQDHAAGALLRRSDRQRSPDSSTSGS